jgi:tetratricopeptide (TPR) repeat protein
MVESQGDEMAAGKLGELRVHLRQQPVMLALLAVLAVICFLAVTGLSRVYHAQRDFLGDRWFTRGVADLSAQHYDSAVTEFRAALLYSRDNYTYQLHLAEALIGLKRTAEASTYLVNLWDRQPEDGLVNLELARIAVEKGQTEPALRYYHNAIYATWPADQEAKRRDARLELIAFLLRMNARAQAESELIALAENLGDDASEQARVGDLFVRTLDYERAFAAYRLSLKADRHDREALAGAGLAAFELGRYPQAHRYLQSAVTADPQDKASADLLKTTDLVLQMDPFQREISMAQRNRIVVEAFAAAGERIKACGSQKDSAASTSAQPTLAESWAKMKPRVTERGLQRDPDLVESAMDLVFNIERQTSTTCGTPAGKDMALLLIAELHERN